MTMETPPLNISARQVIDNIIEGIMITDVDGRIQSVNSTFSTVTGFSPADVIGNTPSLLKSGKHPKSFYRKMWSTLRATGQWHGEICNKKKNGDFYTEYLTITAVKNDNGDITHYLGVFNDITKRKKAEEIIRHLAYYDPLTDLPNRTLFRDRLEHDLAQSRRSKKMLAVIFLDLDRVKIINDTLGHNIGDQLLKEVAARLKKCLREGDTVARLGGDEFMIILPAMDKPESITRIADKILNSIHPPFHFVGQDLYITASMGISIFPFDGDDTNALIKKADTAMYRAKNRGRNNYQIFTPSMTNEVFEELAMGNNLRRALDRGEFVVHYQPQIDTATNQIVGIEALVRWDHPKFGLIAPSRFIRWAEDSGLIIPLGEWVLREAANQVHVWHEKGYSHLRVAINLSARQFKQDHLVERVEKILGETNLNPGSLEMELTESTIMENPQSAIELSQRLRAMGIRFSIDDFGTGYSSLNYLKRLPVNNLKMDQTFVQDLAVDPNDKAIARAVIGLGHGLNLFVIAEGVETETQRDVLKEYKCDMMQGFLFSKPLPKFALENLLHENKTYEEKSLFART